MRKYHMRNSGPNRAQRRRHLKDIKRGRIIKNPITGELMPVTSGYSAEMPDWVQTMVIRGMDTQIMNMTRKPRYAAS